MPRFIFRTPVKFLFIDDCQTGNIITDQIRINKVHQLLYPGISKIIAIYASVPFQIKIISLTGYHSVIAGATGNHIILGNFPCIHIDFVQHLLTRLGIVGTLNQYAVCRLIYAAIVKLFLQLYLTDPAAFQIMQEDTVRIIQQNPPVLQQQHLIDPIKIRVFSCQRLFPYFLPASVQLDQKVLADPCNNVRITVVLIINIQYGIKIPFLIHGQVRVISILLRFQCHGLLIRAVHFLTEISQYGTSVVFPFISTEINPVPSYQYIIQPVKILYPFHMNRFPTVNMFLGFCRSLLILPAAARKHQHQP